MKKALSLLLVCVLALSLCACAATSTAPAADTAPEAAAEKTEGPKGKIGMLALSLSYDFQIKMAEGIRKAAEENGYEYAEYDFQGDAEKEISGIETLMNSGVDAFYGIFMSPEAAAEKISEYENVGVISQDVMSAANANVTTDYKQMAEFFCASLKSHIEAKGLESGDIACLWLPTCENKDSGFYTAMLEIQEVIHKEFDGTAYNYTNDYIVKDVEDSANGTVQIMNANPNVRFFFTFNNNYATLCANEISAANSDVSEYFVYSTADDAEVLRQIASGESPLRACAYGDVVATGYETGLQLINFLENGQIQNVPQQKTLVDFNNIGDYYTE